MENNVSASDASGYLLQDSLWPAVVYTLLLMLTGTIGNTLVLLVYRRHFRHSVTRMFIFTLAVLDLGNCLIGMSSELFILFHFVSYPSAGWCKASRYLTYTFNGSSSIILIAIALDRYYKVCRPYEMCITVSRARKICVGGILVTSLLAAPSLVMYGRVEFPLLVRDQSVEILPQSQWVPQGWRIYNMSGEELKDPLSDNSNLHLVSIPSDTTIGYNDGTSEANKWDFTLNMVNFTDTQTNRYITPLRGLEEKENSHTDSTSKIVNFTDVQTNKPLRTSEEEEEEGNGNTAVVLLGHICLISTSDSEGPLAIIFFSYMFLGWFVLVIMVVYLYSRVARAIFKLRNIRDKMFNVSERPTSQASVVTPRTASLIQDFRSEIGYLNRQSVVMEGECTRPFTTDACTDISKTEKIIEGRQAVTPNCKDREIGECSKHSPILAGEEIEEKVKHKSGESMSDVNTKIDDDKKNNSRGDSSTASTFDVYAQSLIESESSNSFLSTESKDAETDCFEPCTETSTDVRNSVSSRQNNVGDSEQKYPSLETPRKIAFKSMDTKPNAESVDNLDRLSDTKIATNHGAERKSQSLNDVMDTTSCKSKSGSCTRKSQQSGPKKKIEKVPKIKVKEVKDKKENIFSKSPKNFTSDLSFKSHPALTNGLLFRRIKSMENMNKMRQLDFLQVPALHKKAKHKSIGLTSMENIKELEERTHPQNSLKLKSEKLGKLGESLTSFEYNVTADPDDISDVVNGEKTLTLTRSTAKWKKNVCVLPLSGLSSKLAINYQDAVDTEESVSRYIIKTDEWRNRDNIERRSTNRIKTYGASSSRVQGNASTLPASIKDRSLLSIKNSAFVERRGSGADTLENPSYFDKTFVQLRDKSKFSFKIKTSSDAKTVDFRELGEGLDKTVQNPLTEDGANINGNEREVRLPDRQSTAELLNKNRRRVSLHPVRTSRMLFIISLAFLVSFLPFFVVVIMRSASGSSSFLTSVSQGSAGLASISIFVRSTLLSNAVNPIIYGLLSTHFRRECKDLICCLLRRRGSHNI